MSTELGPDIECRRLELTILNATLDFPVDFPRPGRFSIDGAPKIADVIRDVICDVIFDVIWVSVIKMKRNQNYITDVILM